MNSPVRSLLRTEAEHRRRLLAVDSYDVRLDLTGTEGEGDSFGSVTTLRFTGHERGETFLDLKPRAVRSVTLDGVALDVGTLAEGRLPLVVEPGAHELVVDAVMPTRHDGEGMHAHTDPADGRRYLYVMSFMDAAPSVFACFDQPDLKAPYTLHVTAPVGWTVVGNGSASEVEPGRWELATTPPLSTYFVTVVAGPYHVLRDEHDGIPLGLSARASLAPQLDRDAEELFTLTRQSFDEMHRLFGIRYPFGDYHQAFVPEFNAGAMENPGCVTFRDDLVFPGRATRGARIQRATTVAHEMAHQWFGNIVTPQWWDDLWLNESFAEYLGNRVTADVTQYDDAWVNVAYTRRQWGLLADARPTTHPVAGNGAEDALSALQSFDGISYAKGSTVLKQLAATLGDDVFFAGVVDHLERHRFGNATMHDLVASWERSGAPDLTPFVEGWLLTAGPDVVTHDRESGALDLAPPAAGRTRTHTLLAATHGDAGWEVDELVLDAGSTPYDAGARPVVLDARHQSWAVLVPDATTLAGLAAHLPSLEDAEVRAAAWNNLRSGVTEGAVDPAAVVEVAVASPPVEDVMDAARNTVPWLLGTVVPAAPSGSMARVHAAFAGALEAAEPGSERQLASLRAAVRSAVEASPLRAWLEPDGMPEGIDLDVELRWLLLGRLATLGHVEVGELDDALAAQPTTAARVAHTLAIASLPTPEAKAFAWERFTGAVEVPNYELEAAGLGLWRGGPTELTQPYVERYFADLPATAEVRGGWVLAQSTEVFYPLVHVEDDVLRRAHDLLDREGALSPPMRKRVLDQADETARRLALRTAYPHA